MANRTKIDSPFDAPFKKGRSTRGTSGQYDHNDGPFDAAHDTGNGGIPLKFYDDLGKAGTPGGSTPAPGQVAPSSQGPNRAGTKQYPFGGK